MSQQLKELSLRSPAKINLYLRLMGKRSDGYNNLITVFQRISLSDHLHFKKAERGCRISCDQKSIPLDQSNLISQAFSALKAYSGFKGGINVVLEKNIPAKAGLGGASSNAATTLIAVNKLYNLGLRQDDLSQIGKQLGADVSFFLTNDSLSLGINRGDDLICLKKRVPKMYYVLCVFREGLSTRDVYKSFKYASKRISLTKICSEVIMLPLFLSQRDVSAIAGISYNDLLKPASRLKPCLKHFKHKLKSEGIDAVQMTGSGSTMYIIAANRKEASRIVTLLSPGDEYSVQVAHSF